MDNLSFNNKDRDSCSLYFKENFMKDFMYRPNLLLSESKNEDQKEFEKYLINKKIVIIDYAKVISNQKYFITLTNYINSTDRKTIVYSCKNLSYISPNCIFYKYNIPKNPTMNQFENIYKYLFDHNLGDRNCSICCKNDPFYYCINCGQYYCKVCVYSRLKVVDYKENDIYYMVCNSCSNFNYLYTIPAYHTPF